MTKNIQTHNAKIDLIKRFLDYANVADASYALLEYIKKNTESDRKNNVFKADNLTFGDKLQQDIKVKDDKGNLLYIKPKGTNTAYACAIEARFNEEKIGSLCIPLTNACLIEKDKIDNNNITQVKLDSKLSKRTITFTNRFKLLKHQENTSSGFSATLFKDTQADSKDSEYILAFRGTEFPSGFSDDVLDADADLANSKLPSNQYIDMIKFYTQCIIDKHITESTPLIIIGHSLGGALAQLLTLSLATAGSANNVKEVYTFNSPGAKNLRINEDTLGKVYEIDSTILNAKDKERALFKKIRGYEYKESVFVLPNHTNYDSALFNAIYKYLSNNENLKEHSILVRTLKIETHTDNMIDSKIIYLYEIFSINETFINCLETLKANNRSKQPLACQDSIHHIKTDEDSNPDNNVYIKNFIQYLGTDIAGKHYYINLLSNSHFILPTIHALQKVLMYMNSGNIDNLLEYNKLKDLRDESMFLRINRDRKNAELLLHTQPNFLYNLYY